VLSVASVSSASGAATYYAGDNYYTEGDLSEHSSWQGQGAEALGLSGEVETADFENILKGKDTSGADLKERDSTRPGMDLVFSMPKNVGIMALVGGDQRLMEAQSNAVKATMQWAEKNLAASRQRVDGKLQEVKTGNLVYALFTHDTSRTLDPSPHTHAVISNLTQLPDGKWQSLHNDALWKLNTTMGMIYHATLRSSVEKLGYEPETTGKHGQWDIKGIPSPVTKEFSTRRGEILEKAEALGVHLPETLDKISIATRDPKQEVADRDQLYTSWNDRAAALGFDSSIIRAQADARQIKAPKHGLLGKIEQLTNHIGELRQKFGDHVDPNDRLLTQDKHERLAMPIENTRTEWAVASAIHALSECEAAFPQHLILKQALEYALPGVTVDRVEARIEQLIKDKQLLRPEDKSTDVQAMVTTPKALKLEHYVVDTVQRGKGQGASLMSYADAAEKLTAVSGDRPLNEGQFVAASMILASGDKYLAVQGLAGSGKSTLVEAFSRVTESVAGSVEGSNKSVVGLASYNKMASDLKQGAGIETRTVASFVNQYEKIAARGTDGQIESAKEDLKDKIFIVDESSVVGNSQMASLLFIAEKLGPDKMAFIGDRLQLPAIESGKPYALMQESGVTTAQLSENLRQKTPLLREVAATARGGNMSGALQLLGPDYLESKDTVSDAANKWLALSAEERAETLIVTPGRESRDAVNQAIQSGLKKNGMLGGDGKSHSVLEQVSTTKEDLRYASFYKQGMIVDVIKGERAAGLSRGTYEVTGSSKDKYVHLKDGDGRKSVFQPQAMRTSARNFAVSIYAKKDIQIHEGDKIRWTDNEKQSDVYRSAGAEITNIDGEQLTAEWKEGEAQKSAVLEPGDKMYERFDLNYATNTHPAQGVTSTNVIAILSAQIRKLATKQLAYVALTREKLGLTVITDSKEALEKQLDKSQSEKTSALEALGLLNDPETMRREVEALLGKDTDRPNHPDKEQDTNLDRDDARASELDRDQSGTARHQEANDTRPRDKQEPSAKDAAPSDTQQTSAEKDFVESLMASLPERDRELDR